MKPTHWRRNRSTQKKVDLRERWCPRKQKWKTTNLNERGQVKGSCLDFQTLSFFCEEPKWRASSQTHCKCRLKWQRKLWLRKIPQPFEKPRSRSMMIAMTKWSMPVRGQIVKTTTRNLSFPETFKPILIPDWTGVIYWDRKVGVRKGDSFLAC